MRYSIFQYVPMSKPKALSKMLPKIINSGARIVLDLEDSVQDTLNPENTTKLKKDARDSVIVLLDELFKKNIEIENCIYIRINSFESGELEEDIKIVKNILKDIKNIGLFVPMINSIEDICRIKNLLLDDFHKIKLIPIIETVSGYENLQEILNNTKTLNIEYIHYGHYDYSLDSKQWPFVEQNESSFWDFIEQIVDIVEKSDTKYMHTPFGNLTEETLYKSIIKRLIKVCKSDFAITALNYNQVLFAQDIKNSLDLVCEQTKNNIDKTKLAHEVIDIFENNQCSKRSFSVDIKKAKFLTPHEYKMAKQYLKGLKNARD